jgi:predicted Zn-dependent protease
MPKTVVGVKSTMRDHTISVPAPENTIAFAIPNACNECHAQRPAAWAVSAMKNWWPRGRRSQLIARAQAFSGARTGRPQALDMLLHLAQDSRESAIVRANAIGYLRNYDDQRATAALRSAMSAEQPELRVVAASNLKVAADLLRAMDDPRRNVRVAALGSLVKVADASLDAVGVQRVARVSGEFATMARLYEDDAKMQSALGVVDLRTGQFDLAATALSNSLGLEPGVISTRFLLALALLGQHRLEDARVLLRQVPASDPLYPSAQERLQYIGSLPR